MIRAALALAAAGVATLGVAAGGSAAPAPANVTCSQDTQAFSGVAHDLIVPADGYCRIENATITHDVIVRRNSGGDLIDTTIGHDALYAEESGGDIHGSSIGNDLRFSNEGGADIRGTSIGNDLRFSGDSGADLFETTVGRDLTVSRGGEVHLAASQIGRNLTANGPTSIQTGGESPDAGNVRVGNDFVINGSPGPPDPDAFVFDGLCDLSVGHDLRITNRWATFGIGLGDNCALNGRGPVTVGRDLVFSGNQALTGFFGPSALEVGGVTVGRNLAVSGNSAAAYLEVADNTVAGDATCRNNTPAASLDPLDGPNAIGGMNNGCP